MGSLQDENIIVNIVESLYNHLKTIYSNKITATNIVTITSEIIQITEKYKGLTGMQKKLIVINVIKKIVNSQIGDKEELGAINLIIDFTLPAIIDNLISAINGEFAFTAPNKEKSKQCIKNLFCC